MIIKKQFSKFLLIYSCIFLLQINSAFAEKSKRDKPIFTKPTPTENVLPFDYKGLPLGSSLEEFKTKFPDFNCKESPGGKMGDAYCTLSPALKCISVKDYKSCEADVEKLLTYAGINTSYINFNFFFNQLSMVNMLISSGSFNTVVEAIKEKNGVPSSDEITPVTNKMGAKFENEIIEWKRAGTTIRAEKYGTTLNNSTIKIMQDSYMPEFSKRNKEEIKQKAKDI